MATKSISIRVSEQAVEAAAELGKGNRSQGFEAAVRFYQLSRQAEWLRANGKADPDPDIEALNEEAWTS